MRYLGRLLALSLVACSSGEPPRPGPKPSAATPYGGAAAAVTFHEDVEPILQGHCQKCHVAGGLAPFALGTYAEARDMAPAMVAQTCRPSRRATSSRSAVRTTTR